MTNQQQKNEYLQDLMEDFAILHNLYIKEAIKIKQLHDILLGAQNAVNSGLYDDKDIEEFKELIRRDLEGVYGKEV